MLKIIEHSTSIPAIVYILCFILLLLTMLAIGIGILCLICWIISKYVVAAAKEIMDYKVEVQTELARRNLDQ